MTGLLLPKPTRRLPSERRRVAKVSKRPSAKDRATADRLCSALVKQRAGNRCEDCGARGEMDWAHGMPRRFIAVRWAHANTFSLCRRCHRHYTANPGHWDGFLERKLGLPLYIRVRVVASVHLWLSRVDVVSVIANLRKGITQMERESTK